MGERIALATAGGKPFSAWRATPGDARRGGLVVLHAIWGVTPHLREFCDGLADQGAMRGEAGGARREVG